MWCNIKSNQCSLNVPFCNLATVTVKTSSSQHASRTDGEQKHDSLLTFDTPHTWFMKYKEELSDFNVATWSCWDAFPGAQDSAEVMLRTRRQTLMQALFRRNEKRYSHWKPFGDVEREREREREREKKRLNALHMSRAERALNSKHSSSARRCAAAEAWDYSYAVAFMSPS